MIFFEGSHLMGTFYRTIRLVEQGIKPVYVFDGKPPDLKDGELAKRAERRDEAQKLLQAAEEAGNCVHVPVPVYVYMCTHCKKLHALCMIFILLFFILIRKRRRC